VSVWELLESARYKAELECLSLDDERDWERFKAIMVLVCMEANDE
jgi:hypothetical protein